MFGFLGNIGPWELILILLVALIVVGPGKLPEVAKSIGKAVNEFRKATSGVKKEFQEAISLETKPEVKTRETTPQPKSVSQPIEPAEDGQTSE